MDGALKQAFHDALRDDDRDRLAALIEALDEIRTRLDDGLAGYVGRPPLAGARSIQTARMLMEHGATLERVAEWWTPGFGVIGGVKADVGRFLIEQGADASVHTLAGLGLLDHVERLAADDPDVVHARGGDACTPLHFARDVAMARFLIEHGADLDARDEDHNSTPVQWLIKDSPEVARYLLSCGATPDLFVAVALGDRDLVDELISRDRRCLSLWIGKDPDFPAIGYEGLGGTILQWSLGFNSFAHQIALKKGNQALYEHLFAESDVQTQFLVACLTANREVATRIASENPGLVGSLPESEVELPARYCWETNASHDAVELMLDVGFPVDVPETRHGYSPLHNAAWGGYAPIVDLLLERGHPVDVSAPDSTGTPLGWALHCCLVDGRHPEGEYDAVVTSLIKAGAEWEATTYPSGDPRVDKAFEPFLRERLDGLAILGDRAAVEAGLRDETDPEQLAAVFIAAARAGRVEICELLLGAGVPVQLPGFWSTPLHKACEGNALPVVNLVLAHGADIDARSGADSTPLQLAACGGADLELVDVLLAHGAGERINHKNKYEETAVDLALERGYEELAEYLRKHGGKGFGELEGS